MSAGFARALGEAAAGASAASFGRVARSEPPVDRRGVGAGSSWPRAVRWWWLLRPAPGASWFDGSVEVRRGSAADEHLVEQLGQIARIAVANAIDLHAGAGDFGIVQALDPGLPRS